MGKAPAFQFYVRDWLSDPQLRMASHITKGIWIDMLCFMWEAPERGKLQGSKEELMQLISATDRNLEHFLEQAKKLRFADVTICNNEVTLCNRRMVREQKERENTRLRVKRHREKQESNNDVTVPSSSSSSSSTSSLLKKAPEDPKGLPSEEEIKEGAKTKIEDHINQTVDMLYKDKIFPKAPSFVNKMKKQNKNPRAILHVLCRCYLSKPEKPWAFCLKIIETEDGNYNERDYRRTHKKENY